MLNSRVTCALVLSLFATAIPLAAQSNTCLAKLQPNVFTRVPVLIDTQADESTAAILPAADILTQILTERIRKRVGSETGTLSAGDSLVSWQQLGGSVIVTTKRDGTFTWKNDTTVSADFMGTKGLDILTRALTEASAGGERVFWPENAKQDSLSFQLSFVTPGVRENGKLEPLKVRVANPVFTLMIPWFKAAEMSEKPRIDYPIRPQSGSAEGKVVLDFVVDSLGHIDPASVKEVAPAKKPIGEDGAYYQRFLASTIRGVPSGKYKPATIGGCPINQQVRQSFDFKLAQQ
jgi:hypothetical protein